MPRTLLAVLILISISLVPRAADSAVQLKLDVQPSDTLAFLSRDGLARVEQNGALLLESDRRLVVVSFVDAMGREGRIDLRPRDGAGAIIVRRTVPTVASLSFEAGGDFLGVTPVPPAAALLVTAGLSLALLHGRARRPRDRSVSG